MVESKKVRAVAWALFTATVLLTPGFPEGSGPDWVPASLRPIADKVVHAFLFFVLVLLTDRAVHRRESGFRSLEAVLISTAGLVVLLEFGQLWVPNRTFEVADILAGLAGSLVAALWVVAKYR